MYASVRGQSYLNFLFFSQNSKKKEDIRTVYVRQTKSREREEKHKEWQTVTQQDIKPQPVHQKPSKGHELRSLQCVCSKPMHRGRLRTTSYWSRNVPDVEKSTETSPWSRMRLVVRRYVLNDSEAWRWNKILKKQQQPIIWFNATLMLPTLSLKAAVHCLIRKEHRFGEAGENWLHFSSAARCMKA